MLVVVQFSWTRYPTADDDAFVFEAIVPFGISCVGGGADINNSDVVILVVSGPSHTLKIQRDHHNPEWTALHNKNNTLVTFCFVR